MTAIRNADEIPLDRPARPLPPSAWDCHAHVFGPFDRHPLPEVRRYDPPEGGGAAYRRMLDTTGFAHGVLVHAAAYGFDNACVEDALRVEPGRIAGVCTLPPSTPDAELRRMDELGFRAMRFTITHERARTFPGALGFEELEALAPRFRALGWHAQVWANCADIVAHADLLRRTGLTIAVDHLGYLRGADKTADPAWRAFLDLAAGEGFYVKLTTLRVADDGFFDGARGFHDDVLARLPDRALFGSDWPYISRDVAALSPARQVDVFDAWTNDEALRRKVFVDNPARLFGAPFAG